MPEEIPSLRDTLESAIEEHTPVEEAPETAPVESAADDAPADAPVEEAAPGRARDEHGKFAKAEKPTKTAAAPGKAADGAKESAPVADAGKPAATDSPPAAAAPASRAPQSWKPAEREAWAKVPAEAQAAVLRREREVEQALQRAAESAKGPGAYGEVVRPYEAQIRAAGMEPTKYVESLLQTAHALVYAPPHQKADVLAHLVMQYGPDLLRFDQQDAEGNQTNALGRAIQARLSGHHAPAAPQAPQQNVEALVQRALDQRDQQARSSWADRKLEEFMANAPEFVNDVWEDMQVLLVSAARAGRQMDYQQAYDRACRMNDEVSKILDARKATEAVRAQAPRVQRAKVAASSIKPSPGGSPAGGQARSLRETIEEAMASQR